MKKSLFHFLLTAVLVSACGIAGKSPASKIIPTPSADEAAGILGISGASVFVIESGNGPAIYGMKPHSDSAKMDIITMNPVRGSWKRTASATYPFADDIVLPLVSSGDSAAVRKFGGKTFLTMQCLRTDGTTYQKSVVTYCPDEYSMEAVSFTGKKRRDGKIYGSSNLRMLANPDREQLVWAESVLKGEKNFVFLSEAQLKSDQAIEWWISKNPGKPSRITFGELPDDCTLVSTYLKKKKESGQGYYAAMFDTTDYTVIVARSKSTGSYILAWVEPRCRNSRTDALLNNIYFSSGSRLTMFYYKGNRTYKYSLTLANGDMKY